VNTLTSTPKTTLLPPGDLFDVDEFACIALAKRLRAYRPSGSAPLPPDQISNHLTLKIVTAAICHQINWDFLNHAMRRNLLEARSEDMISRLCEIRAPEFATWFEGYSEPDRIHATERAAILREVASVLQTTFRSEPKNILEKCGSRLAGPRGFYEQMDSFSSFREDPLRKKTNVLTHDIVRERLARFTDEENIAPAIDYHLIRIYLRTGRVFSKHKSIFNVLTQGDPRPRPRLVKLLREKVAYAVRLTAKFSELSVPEVNYIEWQLGRRICVREAPRCLNDTLVSDLDPNIAILFEGSCPFSGGCAGFCDKKWMELQEPVFKKTFY
jgi:hypothetical protein